MLALLALLSLTSPGARELTVDVPLYVGADLDDEILENALREVDAVFAPGGIRLRFVISPNDATFDPAVTVVLQPRPARHVVKGCSRNRHDHRLGHTNLPGRRITLWTEQILRAVDGDWDRRELPNVSKTAYARALGRVLAHELGHLFLRLNGHRENGLMRASFSHSSLTAKRSQSFRMSEKDLRTIRAALDRARKSIGASY